MTHSLLLASNGTTARDTSAVARPVLVIGSSDCPEWVQLVPAGEFAGVDGRGPWRVADAAAVIAASMAMSGGMDLPIDYGHAMEHELHGNSAMAAEAAGWITKLEVRNGGEIWGQVEWTAPAAAKIQGRMYRGISPVFYHDAQGVVRSIARAGLTNTPNLRIKSLNAREGTEPAVTIEQLKALRARLVGLFALPETSDDAALIARCSAALEAESGMAKVASSFTLAATATTDDVLKAVQAAKSTTVDATKYVPMEQYTALNLELQKATAAQTDVVVDAAITAGKITPANRDWAKTLCSTNRQAFDDFVAKAPVIVAAGAEKRDEPPAKSGTLDATEKQICAQAGISEAEFLKTRETK